MAPDCGSQPRGHPPVFRMCGKQRTLSLVFLDVWQIQELWAHFPDVWQGKELRG